MDALCQRTGALVAALAGIALSLAALPAIAHATSVSVRVESTGGPLVPKTNVTLPTGSVAPSNALDGQTCPGNSVIGALDTATGKDWGGGQWSNQVGWNVERVKNVTNLAASGRHWVVYLNRAYLNDPPCQKTLSDGDSLLFFSQCDTATTLCFSKGPLTLLAPATIGPGAPIGIQVWETNTTFDNQGIGSSQTVPSVNTPVIGPDGSTTTDQYYGNASLKILNKGESVISTNKPGRVPDRATVCVTDGADGYCGTTVPDPTPFDPLAFCKTTGSDGLCGSPDRIPPVGHISQPIQAH
jgi:hypothetical protein